MLRAVNGDKSVVNKRIDRVMPLSIDRINGDTLEFTKEKADEIMRSLKGRNIFKKD